MNRFGAFAVHLGISLIIFIILGYLILFHWYPDFFFASDGGWQGIRIVAFVDLVLGPVLTLVVFNKAKPKTELRRDLTIIGTIQAVCLSAGVWVVHAERPIAMVFSDGFFNSMSADDYLSVNQPIPDFSEFTGSSPRWVSVELPTDPAVQADIRRRAMENQIPVRTLAEYYVPFETAHINSEQDGIPIAGLLARDKQTPFLDAFLELQGGRLEDYAFIPFGTRYSLALIAYHLDTQTLNYLVIPGGILEAKPSAS